MGLVVVGAVTGAIGNAITLSPTLTVAVVSALTVGAVLAAYLSPSGLLRRHRRRRWLTLASLAVALTLPVGVALTYAAEDILRMLILSIAAAAVSAVLLRAGFAASWLSASMAAALLLVTVAILLLGIASLRDGFLLMGVGTVLFGGSFLLMGVAYLLGSGRLAAVAMLPFVAPLVVACFTFTDVAAVVRVGILLIAAMSLLIAVVSLVEGPQKLRSVTVIFAIASLLAGLGGVTVGVEALLSEDSVLIGSALLLEGASFLVLGVAWVTPGTTATLVSFQLGGVACLVLGFWTWTNWGFVLLGIAEMLMGIAFLMFGIAGLLDVGSNRQRAVTLVRFLHERPRLRSSGEGRPDYSGGAND